MRQVDPTARSWSSWPGSEAVRLTAPLRGQRDWSIAFVCKRVNGEQSCEEDFGIALISALRIVFTESEVVKTCETSGSSVTISARDGPGLKIGLAVRCGNPSRTPHTARPELTRMPLLS